MDPILSQPSGNMNRRQKRVHRWAMVLLVLALGAQQFFAGGSSQCCPLMNQCSNQPDSQWALEATPAAQTLGDIDLFEDKRLP